jgi:hypothetical protein
MFLGNNPLERKIEQEQPAREYRAEVILKLQFLQQEVYRLGNDSGETSQIGELIEKFKKDEISDKKALEEAWKIIYGKEAGIDANSGGH